MTTAAKQLDALCHLTAQSISSLETSDHFQVIKLLGEGSYGKVMLAVHRKRGTPMALKLFPRGSTSLISFLREYNLSLSFCTHPSLTRALGIVFCTPVHYVFAQQAALYGDLFDIIVPEVGVEEECVQRVASQLSGALSHLHSLGFVHRDVKPENVFLCDQTCHWVKLGDFGMAKPKGAKVPGVWYESPYCVPEVELAKDRKGQTNLHGKYAAGLGVNGIVALGNPTTDTESNDSSGEGGYKKILWVTVEVGIDSWALGILVYSMLTGSYPWKETSTDDPGYRKYKEWVGRERDGREEWKSRDRQGERGEKIKKKWEDLGNFKELGQSKKGGSVKPNPTAPQFATFTPLACNLFQKLLEPKPSLRAEPEEVLAYVGGAWLLKSEEQGKGYAERGVKKH